MWANQIHTEKDYWQRRLLQDPPGENMRFRLDPDSRIQDWISIYLSRDEPVNRLLDVGSGPLSVIGKKCGFTTLEITCADPNGAMYEELLREHDIPLPPRMETVQGERLTSRFPENHFDVVFSNNAIDHCHHVVQVLTEMVRVVKAGGFVVVQVNENEGKHTQYSHLHQWDCYIQDGKFFVKGRYLDQVDVGEEFKEFAEVVELKFITENPAGREWQRRHIRFVMKKLADPPSSTAAESNEADGPRPSQRP